MSEQVMGLLGYLSPQATSVRRYCTPYAELRLGEFEPREVPIHNARPLGNQLSLQRNGFMLTPHVSRVSNFRDPHEVGMVYPAEMERLLMQLTGAHRVATFGYGHRSAAAYGPVLNPHRCQVTVEPSTDVHVDYTPHWAGERALFLLRQMGIPPSAMRRFMVINVWRAITDPPQNWPLTLCDGNTTGAGEGFPDATIPVAVLPNPDEIRETLPAGVTPVCGMAFHFNPAHRWYYFPDMTLNEVVVFVQHDSAQRGAWRTLHTSFADAGAAHAAPRESVEMRAIAYFF